MQKIILAHNRAPGDIVAMTGLVRDLALTYPGRYEVAIHTPCRDLWTANPYLTKHADHRNVQTIRLDYGAGIRRSAKTCLHFLRAWHDNFREKTGVDVPLLYPRPDLHLTADEKRERLVPGRYWVVVAGGKKDFTTKHWVYGRHQEVAHLLRARGITIVQAGATDKGPPPHFHPTLEGVHNLVGRTNLREFLRLIYQADGVICTITLAMHVAAAFDKPCVVTAGGREAWWWEGYHRDNAGFGSRLRAPVAVNHRYLHTLGLLDCCRTNGCWKSKVLASELKDPKQRNYCSRPVQAETGQYVPECMQMIQTRHVVEAVLSYYADGTLPPLENGVSPLETPRAHEPRHSPDRSENLLSRPGRTPLVLAS